MSFRLEMLQVARLAPSVLGDAVPLITAFIESQQNADGGFCDREGNSDLYYTSFGVDAMTALQISLPEDRLAGFLARFGSGEDLDFVGLCCLARIWSALPSHPLQPEVLARILDRIEGFRTPDGGYNPQPKANHGTTYGCLLAWGGHADHHHSPPNPEGILHCLDRLQTDTAAWSNDPERRAANVPATAAAVTLCRNLHHPIPAETGGWLLSCHHPHGGFLPFPGAPLPDLLCTAVALHSLDGLQVSLDAIKERCLDFVDSLWTAEGGFHGNWTDHTLDLEYTYYGLLALGHLAL